jgi:hypothetical protein
MGGERLGSDLRIIKSHWLRTISRFSKDVNSAEANQKFIFLRLVFRNLLKMKRGATVLIFKKKSGRCV